MCGVPARHLCGGRRPHGPRPVPSPLGPGAGSEALRLPAAGLRAGIVRLPGRREVVAVGTQPTSGGKGALLGALRNCGALMCAC